MRPVVCALCGARNWNDTSVIWLGPTWESPLPYCAGDCAKDILRLYPVRTQDVETARARGLTGDHIREEQDDDPR